MTETELAESLDRHFLACPALSNSQLAQHRERGTCEDCTEAAAATMTGTTAAATATGHPPARPDFEVWDPRSGNMLRSAPGPDVRAWLRGFRERHGDEAAMALSAGPGDDSWTVTGVDLLRLCEAAGRLERGDDLP